MRMIVAIWFFLTALVACSENPSESSSDNDKIRIEKTDTVYKIDPLPEKPSPLSDDFIEFVTYLDSLRLIPDTIFQKKTIMYDELKKATIVNIQDKLFYTFPKKNHRFMKNNAISFDTIFTTGHNKVISFDTAFAYYGTRHGPDLVLEQLTYPNEARAQEAYELLSKDGYKYYTNVNSAFNRKGKYVFVLHTRAMAFYYDFKSIFDKLEKW